MSYLKYFFNPSHIFTLRPPVMSLRALIILGVIFVSLIVAGIVIKIYLPKIKDGLKVKGFRRLSHLCFTQGITGAVYWFFAWQGIALLSSRFWLLIWAISLVLWLYFIYRYLYIKVPMLRKDIDSKRKFSQYIP